MITIRSLLAQFVAYLASGGAAAILALAFYAVLVQANVWYVAASVLSDALGLLLVFVFNKYLVFQKKEKTIPHVVRYAIVQVANTVIQAAILYVLVQFAGMDKILARIISIGLCVPMNFLLYKYFVYI